MIQARYRRDYDGEFVITETRLADGKTSQTREWVPNAIDNYHISGRAAVIGSSIDSKQFDWTRLQKHRGGLLGKKRLQTYGSGNIWKDMKFDFFVSTNNEQISLIEQNNYDQNCTVYTSPRHCLEHPGRFYLIPFFPTMDNLALAIYLAAFDEHKEVFLLGYDNSLNGNTLKWREDVNEVFKTFDTTKFYLVGRGTNPHYWTNHSNVEIMPYRKFITYCDI